MSRKSSSDNQRRPHPHPERIRPMQSLGPTTTREAERTVTIATQSHSSIAHRVGRARQLADYSPILWYFGTPQCGLCRTRLSDRITYSKHAAERHQAKLEGANVSNCPPPPVDRVEFHMHTNPRPTCEICGKRYVHWAGLHQHMLREHHRAPCLSDRSAAHYESGDLPPSATPLAWQTPPGAGYLCYVC